MKYFLLFSIIFANVLIITPAHALQMPSGSNDGIEAQVRELFADTPDMVSIAQCESGFRQYGNSGMPLLGGTNGNYVGIFQISAGHDAEARSLGMDIYTSDGNMAYARYLYGKQGTQPWSSCLGNSTRQVNNPAPPSTAPATAISTAPTPISNPITTSNSITTNLKLGMTDPQVFLLQKLLNVAGFTIATTGPGSPGNETQTFGQLTRAALQKYQCSKGIVCGGSESTTGYGYAGPRTRASLNSLGH